MKLDRPTIFILIISLIALALRLWNLAIAPASLNADEASLGYHTYSILKTGMDGYGNFLPIINHYANDSHLPFYLYSTVFSVAVFGLNEFAVRFPAAFVGALTVFLSYFAVCGIFKDFKNKNTLGVLVAILLALTPWHFFFSRGTWEANYFLFLALIWIILFFKLKTNKIFYVVLTVIGLILSLLGYLNGADIRNIQYDLRVLLERYLNHFSPEFLFFEGDWGSYRHGVRNVGVLNYFSILLIPLGIYYLVNRQIKGTKFILTLLLLSPVPAMFADQSIHAVLSYLMLVPLTVICALGIMFILEKLREQRKIIKVFALGGISMLYAFGFLYYLDMYFMHYPQQSSQEWQYGYKEVINYALQKENNYKKVVITQKHPNPEIFYLFYSKMESSDKIEFRNIYWPRDRFEKNILYIGGPYEIPENDIVAGESVILKKVTFLNGAAAFSVVETEK